MHRARNPLRDVRSEHGSEDAWNREEKCALPIDLLRETRARCTEERDRADDRERLDDRGFLFVANEIHQDRHGENGTARSEEAEREPNECRAKPRPNHAIPRSKQIMTLTLDQALAGKRAGES